MSEKKQRSFRINSENLKKLKDKGIDVNKVVNAAIAKVANDKKCPYCGNIVK